MSLTTLDLDALRRWVVAARADLATYAERINRLNVFPVPDADTGTNLLMTIDGAMGSLTFSEPDDLPAAARDLAQATLMAARGNSGVILSQLARGVAEVLAESGEDTVSAPRLAEALRRASDYGWRAVNIPVEGTILTVAGAAADAAAVQATGSVRDVAQAAVHAAELALVNTTQQLEALRQANVVDAGGAGYVLVLASLLRVIDSDGGPVRPLADAPAWLTASAADVITTCHDGAVDGPAYEVMYVLTHSDEERVSRLKAALDRIGDSLVVAGGPDTWSVHVHVDDVSAALNAGVLAGRPQRFQVTRFTDEMITRHTIPVHHDAQTLIVAVAESPGLAELAKSEGRMVIGGDAGRIARAAAVRAIRDTELPTVALVCDGARSSHTGDLLEKSLRDRGVRVIRPGAAGPAEFIAALAVAHPEHTGDEVIAAIDDALIDLSTGSLSIAANDPRTAVGDCPRGAVVGRIDGEVIGFGAEALPVAAQVVQTLLADHEREIVTLIPGEKAPAALADTVRASLTRSHPHLEVSIVEGRGPYVLAIGVE
ncbi:DAK2 domain-containing protein [Yimella sp. cx-51]|uniref:DAK2 domain-containing protein n=1 Tax=Yimella sp. cx-51 TaxID=2770551 RepID=UPI00165E1D98|nr:DAK2 domain-containing protein [Yimella sp. cx-51]MBC9956728.1 DAK2 domain-containing protein [Yimella sp. cx-51]QTH38965.1 DAK2 domain-containing protein [Yimella sp. cx-51]